MEEEENGKNEIRRKRKEKERKKERRMKGRACRFWNVAIIRLGPDTTTVPKGIRGLLLSIVCCRYRFVRVIVL
jgi:hypothetical protein